MDATRDDVPEATPEDDELAGSLEDIAYRLRRGEAAQEMREKLAALVAGLRTGFACSFCGHEVDPPEEIRDKDAAVLRGTVVEKGGIAWVSRDRRAVVCPVCVRNLWASNAFLLGMGVSPRSGEAMALRTLDVLHRVRHCPEAPEVREEAENLLALACEDVLAAERILDEAGVFHEAVKIREEEPK